MSNFCVLFDMDGVMLDTEPLYDKFWNHAAYKYNIQIPNFAKQIKGTTLPNILKKYFSDYTQEERDQLEKDVHDYEASLIFDQIPGSIEFVEALKREGIKVGLVTSSTMPKMIAVNKQRKFDELFDTIITAENVKQGKPNPECFLLGAKNLGFEPKQAFVFEDSFAGIEAATKAGMKVIGLATTHPAELLNDKCEIVIPNFEQFTVEELKKLA